MNIPSLSLCERQRERKRDRETESTEKGRDCYTERDEGTYNTTHR